MKRWWMLLALLVPGAGAHSGEHGSFEGKVAVEWLDDDPYLFKMKLLKDLAYREPKGKVWKVPEGEIVDGRGIPPMFIDKIGHPFDGGFRKAAVIYDYATQKMVDPWPEAQRMFLDASLAEGIPEGEAKGMYLVLATQGSRWEIPGSHCYGSCHGKGEQLLWRPAIDEQKLAELLDFVRSTNPPVEEVDRMALSAILDKGPHVFPVDRCSIFSGSTKVGTRCAKDDPNRVTDR